MADENNSNEDGQFVPDGSMEPLSPQEADNTDYGLMVGERIQKKDLQQEMRDSYLAYAMSVIVDRALPDVRDGMKPVHRRVIYAMYDGGYRPDRGYSKCARVVGEVMGKYHPHGDSAIYDTLVRMAQSWSMRYTLVDGQGNFGSPGDDPAAAMRYTECRMAPLAMEMVRDIDKDTVDFLPNYDGKTQEPTVLPARFPNLLCNGSSGIAVGMATNIPPHNMREVAEGVHWALDHPDASREELLENLIRIIKGPDFPTGATILGHKGIEQAYRTGRGLITMRAVVNTEEIKGRMCLVITELPYQVNPDRLVVSIREAVRDGKIQGIADMRDETSGRTGQRLVLVLKRDAVPKVVLNNLYKHSQLQQTFGANMLALVDGVPRTLSLDAFIRHWVGHQLEVIARRTAYLKREAEERDHILQGYLKALDMIDEVIALIRASESAETARTGLMDLLDVDEVQADAILAMQLRRLAALERQKILDEHNELMRRIADYNDILAKPERQRKIVGDELDEIVSKYGDDRGRKRGRNRYTLRFHQAHQGRRIPCAASRRQGHQGRQAARGRRGGPLLPHQHAQLAAVLHQQGTRVPPEGVRAAGGIARFQGTACGQPAAVRAGRDDPDRAVDSELRSGQVSGARHPFRQGQEDRARRIRFPASGRPDRSAPYDRRERRERRRADRCRTVQRRG